MANSTDAAVGGLCKIGMACLRGEEVFYPGTTFFIDPEAMSLWQLFFAFLTYGYVLFVSADMIGDGAELLLLVPGYKNMVGSIVLPVLGAVPDGMMVLFSGVGALEVAQENVSVGVGALAGSTIMLLTLPWILSVYAGRVDLENGKCTGYKKPAKNRLTNKGGSGIEFLDGVSKNGILMVITALTYFMIQIPAFLVDDQKSSAQDGSGFIPEVMRENAYEKKWAGIGTILSLFFFFGYLYLQYLAALQTEPPKALSFLKHLLPPPPPPPKIHMVKEHGMLLHIDDVRQTFQKKGRLDVEAGGGRRQVAIPYMDVVPKGDTAQALLGKDLPSDLQSILRSFFVEYASRTEGKDLHATDMREVLGILGLVYTIHAFKREFDKADKDHGGTLDQQEFLDFFAQMISSPDPLPYDPAYTQTPKAEMVEDGDDDDDEEEDDMPEDLRNLTPAEQRSRLIGRSCKGMGIGTILVLIFSDPMVDVLAQIGKVSGIPTFYVSFVLGPLASNAAELVSSFKLAQKKTQNSITQSLQTLEGAACMNNTFCLGIFLAMIYTQGLAWKFTAETIAIFAVQVAVFFIVRANKIQTMTTATVIFSLYPLSLVLVAGLEKMGWD